MTILIKFYSNTLKLPSKDTFTVPPSIKVEPLADLIGYHSSMLFYNGNELTDLLQIESKEDLIRIEVREEEKISTSAHKFASGSVSGHSNGVLYLLDGWSAGGDGTLRKWDIKMKTGIKSYKFHSHWIQKIIKIENSIFTGALDGSISRLNLDDSKFITKSIFRDGVADLLEFKGFLIAASRDSTLKVLNGNLESVRSFGHKKSITHMFISSNILYVGTVDGSIFKYELIVDMHNIKINYLSEQKLVSGIYSSIINKDNIFIGTNCGTIYFLNKNRFSNLNLKNSNLRIIGIGSYRNTIYAISYSGDIHILRNRKVLKIHKTFSNVTAHTFNKDLLVTGHRSGMVRVYKMGGAELKMVSESNCNSDVYSLNISDGTLMVGCRDGKIHFLT